MFNVMPLSYNIQSDYGRVEYSSVVQTSSLRNGKVWEQRNPSTTPSARYLALQQQMVQSIVEQEIRPAIEEWLEERNVDVEQLQRELQSTDAGTLVAARIRVAALRNVTQTAQQSLEQLEHFLTKLAPHLRADFLPAIAIDNDGEIDFEWYGRRGANGILYFVSLFHGAHLRSRLLWSSNIPPIILTELDRIYKDKQV
jgi:hypothetical protein